MNLLQRIKAAIIPSQGDAGNKYFQSLFSYFNGDMMYNIPDNPRAYVAEGYQNNPDVYAVVNMIAKKAASVPFYVYVVNNKKSYNSEDASDLRKKANRRKKPRDRIIEDEEDDE